MRVGFVWVPVNTVVAFGLLLGFLAVTIAAELLVALPFRIGKRGLAAVVLVNGVTNPILNLLLLAVYGFGIGYKWVQFFQEPTAVWYAIFAIAEVAVVLVEWRLLNWVLKDTASSRRLLALSVAMNVVSAGIGLLLQG